MNQSFLEPSHLILIAPLHVLICYWLLTESKSYHSVSHPLGQSERVSLSVNHASRSVGQDINQSLSQPFSLSDSHLVSNLITVRQSVSHYFASQSVG